MSQRSERQEINTSPTSVANWLTKLVLTLPSDARSSLKIERLPLVGFTDVRRSSQGNQDRIAVAYSSSPDESSNWLLAVVCDGVGGSANGELAASTAIATLANEVAHLFSNKGAVELLRFALQRAHIRTSEAYQSKSSTTAVALLVTATSAAVGWIGDSRAYQISNGKAELLTIDDTLAAAVAKANAGFKIELNEDYADRLSQAIGGNIPVNANVQAWHSSEDNAVCLLCTDGVWKPIEAAFESAVANCQEGPELMRRLLLMSDWMGGIDNASAILIPPMKEVRGFLRDPVNKTPENFMLMSLPGHLQSLIPVASIAPSATGLPRNEPPWIEPSHQEKKTQAKRKAGGSAKGRVKPIVAPSSQLVIAEEPPDEA